MVFLKTDLNVELHDIKEYSNQFKPVDITHDCLIYNKKSVPLNRSLVRER